MNFLPKRTLRCNPLHFVYKNDLSFHVSHFAVNYVNLLLVRIELRAKEQISQKALAH